MNATCRMSSWYGQMITFVKPTLLNRRLLRLVILIQSFDQSVIIIVCVCLGPLGLVIVKLISDNEYVQFIRYA